jgi:hypothetical protein
MSDPGADWEITPYAGVGPVVLGATREEVEAALGSTATPIDKGGPAPVAAFPAWGVHVHLSAEGRTEAVELMAPARPVLLGRSLLEGAFPDVVTWLRAQDPGLVVDDDGATSELLGVALYAPLAAVHSRRPAEGVIVFERGYYDD